MDLHRLSSSGTSLYQVLELEKEASAEDIKRAYRKLALRYHPDKNPNDPVSVDKFKVVNNAHKLLSDPEKKRIYDEHGSLGIHLAERFGESVMRQYFVVSSWWFRAICGLTCVLTGCCFGCFCCCCFCCDCCCRCCGRLTPEDQDIPDAADLSDEDNERHDQDSVENSRPLSSAVNEDIENGQSQPLISSIPAWSEGSVSAQETTPRVIDAVPVVCEQPISSGPPSAPQPEV